MEIKDKVNHIQEVQLKNGKIMNHMKDKNDRHVFFGDLYAMNIWMVCLLVFILLTSIMMNYWSISLMTQTYNMALMKLSNIEQSLGISGDNVAIPLIPIDGNP